MTYPDPKRVRSHKLTLRLDDYEHALVQALANYQGEQLSTLLRDLLMREAGHVIAIEHAPSVERRAV
jgi:uncharacterized protein (DUF1778 family)